MCEFHIFRFFSAQFRFWGFPNFHLSFRSFRLFRFHFGLPISVREGAGAIFLSGVGFYGCAPHETAGRKGWGTVLLPVLTQGSGQVPLCFAGARSLPT